MNFLKFFRLVFVLFSLYLIGDTFYRWDAFDYYGSLLEFIPGLALISILWSFLAVLATIFIWLLLRIFEWLCHRVKLRISIDHLLLCFGFFILFSLIVWVMKIRLWPVAHSSSQLKLSILAGITVISLFLTWSFRNKAARWVDIVNKRITPLVWLFGVIVMLSIPWVAYLAYSNQAEKTVSKDNIEYSASDKNRPNIILITFDALTARDMSVYGYHRQTTPFISEWAKSASVFTRNEAASNYTAPTSSSLMTGKRVWTHRRFQSNGGKTDKSDIQSLPLLLKNAGYYNMAFIANNIASVQELGMFDSFMAAPPSDEFMIPASFYGFFGKYLHKLFGAKIQLYDWVLQEDFILYRITPDNYFKYPNKIQFPAERVFDMFMTEINSNKYREPYFAWIHVLPPHIPYLAPVQNSDLFNSSPKFRTAKSQDDLVRLRYFTQEQQPEADILRARYDAFIRYCDKRFQDFIEQLTKNKLLKNTVIILSADHGESFEHEYFTHGGPFLFEQQTNIPLIIKEPEQTGGNLNNDLVEQIDTPATILDLAGISAPSWVEGRSLVPLLRGGKLRPKPIFSMYFLEVPVAEKIKTGTVAVWEGDYKLIYYINKNESVLFNLKEDPGELNNIYLRESEIGNRLLNLILDNLEKINERFSG
jgi:arylsulfatase A-like enzyme